MSLNWSQLTLNLLEKTLWKKWCVPQKQVFYVDFCPEFAVRKAPEKFGHLYRYERTKNNPDPAQVDAIHLSEKGVQKFQVKIWILVFE